MALNYNTNYTYQQLVNITKNYIKQNCLNITNFAAVNASLKSGWTTTVQIGAGYNSYSHNNYYTLISLIGNNVYKVTSSQVDTDMTNYLNSIGRTSLSSKIPEKEVLQFLEELMVFCYNHCFFANSQYINGSTFVYSNVGKNNNIVPALSKTDFYKIQPAPVTQMINNFTTNIKVIARHMTAKYRYTWKWSAVNETAGTTTSAWSII